MSIIQFRAISIVVSFNADARFVDIKIPLRKQTGLTGFFRIQFDSQNPEKSCQSCLLSFFQTSLIAA